MSRKPQMSMWKNGHRRSPRISALDAWKAHKENGGGGGGGDVSQNSIQIMPVEHNELGPPSRTRARKKRKLRPVQDVAVSSVTTIAKQGNKSPDHEDHPVSSDQPLGLQAIDSPRHDDGQPSIIASAEWLPEKQILELILDTLQRRDTHEIFAEPVDPEEVEDYYEIIKEPMDFGTMRAKLHEGMYKNLEQFEHDVFLISSNAMHFNSSATIYFRQARALQELSKKVFHVLKTDPRNFELEFSTARRRPRRSLGDAKGSNFNSPPKPVTNLRSRSMTYDVPSKGTRSASSSSNLRRSIRVNAGCSDTASHFEIRDPEILSGPTDVRRPNIFEIEQRCTYRPWTSFLDENESIVSTIYSDPKRLFCVNQRDIGYTESLMMFVKDLGPVAQMVAKKKLQGWWPDQLDQPNCPTPSLNRWFQAPKCEKPAPYSTQQRHEIRHTEKMKASENSLYHVLKSRSHGMDLTAADKGEKIDTSDRLANIAAMEGEAAPAPNSDPKSSHCGSRGKDHSSRVNFLGVLGGNEVHNQRSPTCPEDLSVLNPTFNGMMNTPSKLRSILVEAGKLDNQLQPLAVPSQTPQATGFEKLNLKKADCSTPPSWPPQTKAVSIPSHSTGTFHDLDFQYSNTDDASMAVLPAKLTSSAQAVPVPILSQPKALVSQFIFDLPFLRSQLSQMNSSGQPGMQRGLATEGQFSGKRSHRAEGSGQPSHGSQQRSLLDSKSTDLALQL